MPWESRLRKAIDLNDRFSPAFRELATCLLEMERQSEALRFATRLSELVPGSAAAHALRGSILHELGSRIEAIEVFEVARTLNPYEFFTAEELGETYSEVGQHERAIDAFHEAVQLAEGSFVHADMIYSLLYKIGIEYMALQRYDEAIEAFRLSREKLGDFDTPQRRAIVQRSITECQRRQGK